MWLYSINAKGLLAYVANSQKTYLTYTYILGFINYSSHKITEVRNCPDYQSSLGLVDLYNGDKDILH